MNSYHDPELDDVLQDDELRHIAAMLSSSTTAEPPLDDAFRTGLRRQLMNEAWAMTEGRESWWRRAFAPPGLAWAGAAAGLLLIVSVVGYYALQQPGGNSTTVVATSPLDGNRSVALQQPILVSFNQAMDHPSTEGAVQVTPATNVTYSWADNSRTLAVQPTGGTLAPNTQYKVTIGPGARTASGKALTSPQTVTFVTTSPATPAATPTPRPTPSTALGEKQLAGLDGATAFAGQWSSDSSSLYYVDGKGALRVATLKGGTPEVIAADGASSPSLSPTGDRLAYIRDGKIEVLTFASGKTDETAVTPAPAFVGWAKDKLVWAAAGGIFTQGGDGSAQQLAPLPANGVVTVVKIAPDGAHEVYTQDGNLFVLDLATGQSVQLGHSGAVFQDWSPGGSQLLYATADNVVVADTSGTTVATLPSGDASWSSQDAILIGGDTDVLQVRPDGSNLSKLSNGTFQSPRWAPNGTSFAFVRGGAVWTATAPPLPAEPTALDDATAVVNSFLDARVKGQADQATALLDANGKTAYTGLQLTITGDPKLTRAYVLTSEITGSQPDTARFIVRLVLTHGKLDVSNFEETLVLIRDATSQKFLIDQASAGPPRELGKGAQVVSVEVDSDTVKVTFDSDLDPATVTGGVTIVDANGNAVNATASYANRVVTLTGMNLKPGDHYKLEVLTALRDVQGQAIASEYDLDLVGPSGKKHQNHKDVATASPSPSTPS
jgi:hypothetical protein